MTTALTSHKNTTGRFPIPWVHWIISCKTTAFVNWFQLISPGLKLTIKLIKSWCFIKQLVYGDIMCLTKTFQDGLLERTEEQSPVWRGQGCALECGGTVGGASDQILNSNVIDSICVCYTQYMCVICRIVSANRLHTLTVM